MAIWLVEEKIYVIEDIYDGIEPGRDFKRSRASFTLMHNGRRRVQVEGPGRA